MRSSGCLDTASHKPYMFALIVNGKMKIANIAWKIISKYMLVVQTIFTINGQMENSVKYAFWSYLDKKKIQITKTCSIPARSGEGSMYHFMCMCAGLRNGEGWFGVSSCFHSYVHCLLHVLFLFFLIYMKILKAINDVQIMRLVSLSCVRS